MDYQNRSDTWNSDCVFKSRTGIYNVYSNEELIPAEPGNYRFVSYILSPVFEKKTGRMKGFSAGGAGVKGRAGRFMPSSHGWGTHLRDGALSEEDRKGCNGSWTNIESDTRVWAARSFWKPCWKASPPRWWPGFDHWFAP